MPNCEIDNRRPIGSPARWRIFLLIIAILATSAWSALAACGLGAGISTALARDVTSTSINNTEYWNTLLKDRPRHFLLGYGSLLNSKSREDTSGVVGAAIPVRLSAEFGYIRAWNFQSPTSRITALGLRRRLQGEVGSTINGIIYPVAGDSMDKFDEREEGYTRVLIPRDQIEAIGWMALPASGEFWVYVAKGPSGQLGVGLHGPDARYPILQSYIDICVKGALEYGEDFAQEFLETTFGWNQYWLNDRVMPRRPWVYEKGYQKVDQVLAKFPSDPSRNMLAKRLLPEEYPSLVIGHGRLPEDIGPRAPVGSQ